MTRGRFGSRAVASLGVVAVVVTAAFVVNNVLPSDPARMALGPQARPADVVRMRRDLGLDQPLAVQYGRFVVRLVHFSANATATAPDHATCAKLGPLHVDLGRSYQQRRPVVDILGDRIGPTLLLAAAALTVQVLLGLGLGAIAAAKKRTFVDLGAVAASLVGMSAPTFILGVALQFVLAHRLRLLPLDGYGKTPGEHAVGLVLPALTLGIVGAAYTTRLVRDELVTILAMDHVRTARAKGLGRWRVLFFHGLRNAALPVVTAIGLDLGALVGGAIVTETLFRWPGLGALSTTALLDRDGPVVLGVVLFASTSVVVVQLVIDGISSWLDPRVRHPESN